MKMKKSMAILLAVLLLLGAMPVWAAETDTAEPVTESGPAENVTEEAPAESVSEEAGPSETVPAEEVPAEATTEETLEEGASFSEALAPEESEDFVSGISESDINGGSVSEENPLFFSLNSGTCGDENNDVRWSFSNGVMTISGNGAIKDYSLMDTYESLETYAPWNSFEITSIVVEEGITRIGTYAFMNLHSEQVNRVSLPDSLESIGYGAFLGCGIKEITIPRNVTRIEGHAFAACSFLEKVTFPEQLQDIAADAFAHTPWAEKQTENDFVIANGVLTDYVGEETDIVIPDGVTAIGAWVFYGSEITSVEIPEGVTVISEGAFSHCEKLARVSLPNSLKTIEQSAFELCNVLASVHLPEGLERIESWAFYGSGYEKGDMDELIIPASVSMLSGAFATPKKFVVAEGNPVYTVSDGHIFTKDMTKLVQFRLTDTRTNYTVPTSVHTIGKYAFNGNNCLTSIILPESVTTIEEGAFRGCTALKTIDLPKSVKTIEARTFENCTSFQSIVIPDNVVSIGERAFYSCEVLETVAFPNHLTELGSGAFMGCRLLTAVHLPNTLKSIPRQAFAYCFALAEIELPSKVEEIGTQAFSDCISLKKVVVPDGTKRIGHFAFGNTGVEELSLPDSLTSIGDGAFSTPWRMAQGPAAICGKFLLEYDPPVNEDGESEKITYTIPDGITGIADYACTNGGKLISVQFPASVKWIGKKAFGFESSPFEANEIIVPEFTVIGYSGTAAEDYAKEYGFKFESLGPAPELPVKPGDVTGDGQITSADALQIQRYVVKRSSVLDNAEKKVRDAADVTGEGDITSADALQIQRYVVQRPSVLDGK